MHSKVGFDGTEAVSRLKFLDEADAIGGKDIALLDVKHLCARARFCHQAGGVWELVYNQKDEATREQGRKDRGPVPFRDDWSSGIRRKKCPIEPHFDPSDQPDRGPREGRQRRDMAQRRHTARVRGREEIRNQEPCHTMPLRPVGEQAVLRRQPHRQRV